MSTTTYFGGVLSSYSSSRHPEPCSRSKLAETKSSQRFDTKTQHAIDLVASPPLEASSKHRLKRTLANMYNKGHYRTMIDHDVARYSRGFDIHARTSLHLTEFHSPGWNFQLRGSGTV